MINAEVATNNLVRASSGSTLKNGITREKWFFLSFYLLVFAQIFNTNKFVAALKYTLVPTFLAFVLSILFFNKKRSGTSFKEYLPLFIVSIITAISTLMSNVVSWTNPATAFYIYLILFILMSWHRYDRLTIKSIFKFYTLLCVVISLSICFNFVFKINYNFGRVSFNWLGVIKDQNIVAAFLSYGFFLSISSFLFKKKYSGLLISFLILVSVFMLSSRGGLLTIVGSTFVLLIAFFLDKKIKGRKLIVLLALLIIGGITLLVFMSSGMFDRVLNLENYKYDGRLDLWRAAFEAFTRNPLIGSGYDSGSYYSKAWYDSGSPTHNSYLDILTSVGIIGSFFWLLFFVKMLVVKKENFLFVFSMTISLFLPLLFINGYGTLTFTVPLTVLFVTSRYCKCNSFKDLVI